MSKLLPVCHAEVILLPSGQIVLDLGTHLLGLTGIAAHDRGYCIQYAFTPCHTLESLAQDGSQLVIGVLFHVDRITAINQSMKHLLLLGSSKQKSLPREINNDSPLLVRECVAIPVVGIEHGQ